MQLHYLRMKAIGPFAGTEEIDFGRLGTTGLFLLEGATGAGKSTIIDAICFALYNSVAQKRADAERIHSHHADPQTTPEVELVFETQMGIYKVLRTPRFERPKLRGAGSTVAQPSVKVWRFGTVEAALDPRSDGELLSRSLGEAEDEITRAIGLKKDQFVQTVVLPQGEFASFLKASSDEKGQLLEKVFGTHFFRRVQQGLVESGRAASARWAAADVAGLRARLGETEKALAAALKAAATEAKAQRMQRDALKDSLSEAELRAERRKRLIELQTTLNALTAQQPDIEALRSEAAAAASAKPVRGAARTLSHRQQEQRVADNALKVARTAAPSVLATETPAQLKAAAREREALIGALSGAIEAESVSARVTETVRSSKAKLAGVEAQLTAVEEQRRALPAALAAAQAALVAARDLAALEESRHEAVAAAQELARTSLAHDAALKAEATAQTAAATALGLAQAAEASLGQLRQSRLDNIAGELGLALQEGEPCPVCGSADHPAPALPSPGAVTPEQVDAAQGEAERTRVESEARAAAYVAASAVVREHAAVLKGRSSDEIRAQVVAATALRDEAQRAAQSLPALTQAVEDVSARSTALDEQLRELTGTRSTLAQQIADLELRLREAQFEIDTARGDFATVALRSAHLERETTTIHALVEALEAAGAAAKAMQGAEASLAEDLAAAGLASLTAYMEAERTNEWAVAARAKIDAFDQEFTKTSTLLSGPELEDAGLAALFDDVAERKQLYDIVREQDEEAHRAHGKIAQKLADLKRHSAAIDSALTAATAVIAETEDAIRVGLLANGNGDNQLNIDLTRYVLIRRFTQVLTVANTELARFSGGRYSLEHDDAKKGNARSGLGVKVHDLHTGQVRDVGTLSGGETFYVSLAMALALAEVVRAESGGVDLGTLFVDEGFGTLDPDVLDDVMATLEGLQAGGRRVGIVSHVAELKSRITDRIEVFRVSDQSSKLRVTVD